MLLYFEAEQFLTPDPKNASLVSRVFGKTDSKSIRSNGKQILALVSSTLRFKPYLKEIIKKSGLLKPKQGKLPKKLNLDLSLLLVHDLLLTKSGRIQSSKHPIKDYVLTYKSRLHSEYVKLKLRNKVKSLEELAPQVEETKNNDYTPVRWVRVNTIKVGSGEKFLQNDPFFKNLKKVDSLDEVKDSVGTIYHDSFIPNLYGLNPSEKVTSSEAYQKGAVIIQDRSSCFPAHILAPQKGDKVIDACSAPGNKTTHTASYVGNTKKLVYAFERNPARFEVLKKMVLRAGALKCVVCANKDFTTVNPEEYKDVVGMVVDPSCSGSGIFGRSEDDKRRENEEEKQDVDKERLAKLASFQVAIMKHALSFPLVKKVVYSTCSIHAEENEQVVIDLLGDKLVQQGKWRLAGRDMVLPAWERRGWEKEFLEARYSVEEAKTLAQGCVRSLPGTDGGIGFFAACFVRD